ncbi:putative olfactory receptor 2B8 [Phyllobates terribilis]|uniref:putative olfactory receptor 2B8 n=1 Tax=Phyllobates terribilis TaxID=111132 RepID=UPI003CCAD89A
MSAKNRTIATEFILLGFSTDLQTNILLFVLFLVNYIVTISGNCLIVWLFLVNPQLYIPMYFFLCILSFLDLCTSTSVVPRILVDLFSSRRTISLAACTVQFYTVLFMSGTESLLLALMAYDRYVAICRPLHYPLMMRWRTCYCLTALMWIVSFMVFIIPALSMPTDLCYPNQINHFMCEAISVLQLACEDVTLNEVVMLFTCFVALFFPFAFIIVSYSSIISSVLKIHSKGRSKAFSTCTSHITVVVLAYGTAMIMYFSPSAQYSASYGKYLSLFSLTIAPTVNPLIYTLNNKDVKESMRKVFLKSTIDK